MNVAVYWPSVAAAFTTGVNAKADLALSASSSRLSWSGITEPREDRLVLARWPSCCRPTATGWAVSRRVD